MEGRPYSYSDSPIDPHNPGGQGVLRASIQADRGVHQAAGRGVYVWGAKIPSYTQVCRRQKELKVPLGVKYDKKHPADIAVDSSGIKIFNRGEWVRQKWAVRRGWVKLHISCDIVNHLITSVEVTDEHTADGREFSKLGAMGKADKVFGDSAYDSRDNFNAVQAMGAEPVIKPRMNSTGKSKG